MTKAYVVELEDDEVLVALKRGEGYENAHPKQLSEDAIGDRWPEYRTIQGQELRPIERLQAAKVKLSPGEAAFVESVRKELGGDKAREGTLISYDHTEGRAVAGLEKKGLVRRVCGGEIALQALGVELVNRPANSI
jgi:hypothetical protein